MPSGEKSGHLTSDFFARYCPISNNRALGAIENGFRDSRIKYCHFGLKQLARFVISRIISREVGSLGWDTSYMYLI